MMVENREKLSQGSRWGDVSSYLPADKTIRETLLIKVAVPEPFPNSLPSLESRWGEQTTRQKFKRRQVH